MIGEVGKDGAIFATINHCAGIGAWAIVATWHILDAGGKKTGLFYCNYNLTLILKHRTKSCCRNIKDWHINSPPFLLHYRGIKLSFATSCENPSSPQVGTFNSSRYYGRVSKGVLL
nr:MAG TPA: hypothetical protein [Caudoviricetes sp.]